MFHLINVKDKEEKVMVVQFIQDAHGKQLYQLL